MWNGVVLCEQNAHNFYGHIFKKSLDKLVDQAELSLLDLR